jgi:hypothetical protein
MRSWDRHAFIKWSDDGITFRYQKKLSDLPEEIQKDVRVPSLSGSGANRHLWKS